MFDIKQVAEISLQHFSSSELCPPGPIIPAQRDASFFALLSYISHSFRGIFDNGFSTWFTNCCRKIEVRSWCITKRHLNVRPCLLLLRGASYQWRRGAAPGTDSLLCTLRQWTPPSGSPSPPRAAVNSVLKAPLSRAPARLCRRSSQRTLGSSGQQRPVINTELISKYLMKVLSDLLVEEGYPRCS